MLTVRVWRLWVTTLVSEVNAYTNLTVVLINAQNTPALPNARIPIPSSRKVAYGLTRADGRPANRDPPPRDADVP